MSALKLMILYKMETRCEVLRRVVFLRKTGACPPFHEPKTGARPPFHEPKTWGLPPIPRAKNRGLSPIPPRLFDFPSAPVI